MTKSQTKTLEIIRQEGGIREGSPVYRPYLSIRTGERLGGRGINVRVVNRLVDDGHLVMTDRDGSYEYHPVES